MVESIMLSDINHIEKDILCISYICNLKKLNLRKENVEWWLPGVGSGKIEEMLLWCTNS